MLFAFAQTVTAVPQPVLSSFQEELIKQYGPYVVGILLAVLASLKAWAQSKLATVVIKGVEAAAPRVQAKLESVLGINGMRALKAAGVDVSHLAEAAVIATKQKVQEQSINAGTEGQLSAKVARVTASMQGLTKEQAAAIAAAESQEGGK